MKKQVGFDLAEGRKMKVKLDTAVWFELPPGAKVSDVSSELMLGLRGMSFRVRTPDGMKKVSPSSFYVEKATVK